MIRIFENLLANGSRPSIYCSIQNQDDTQGEQVGQTTV
jgi:hypothetical protein